MKPHELESQQHYNYIKVPDYKEGDDEDLSCSKCKRNIYWKKLTDGVCMDCLEEELK